MRRHLYNINRTRKLFEPFYFEYMSQKRHYVKGRNCNKPERRQRELKAEGISNERTGENRGGSSRPPPGLKGKELGLWYRDRNRQKDKERESKPIPISLDDGDIEELENIIAAAHSLNKKGNSHEKLKEKYFGDKSISFEEKLNEIQIHPLQNNSEEDKTLYNELIHKSNHDEAFKKMLEFRRSLPTYQKRKDILKAIEKNQVVVISGGTGCGKTTQVVQYILDDYIFKEKGSLCKAICTQPRRISAITVAERVASERSEKLGLSVGYVIRLESVQPQRERGTITFVTTGILTQWLLSNPALIGISHVFVDEIHERDTLSDFLLALLKYILPKRPDLRVILMSATLNAEKFSEYFGGVPCIDVPGFLHPVEDLYLEDIMPKINFNFPLPSNYRHKIKDPVFQNYVQPYVRDLEKRNLITKSVAQQLSNPMSEELNIFLIAEVVRYICTNEPRGAILIFVPGLAQIQDLNRKLRNNPMFSTSKTIIVPMHSIMPSSRRDAFIEPPVGVRKIIISTTICETSITIDDVRYVIDCGKNKTNNFDLKMNVRTLEPEWETLANVNQRKGRAGRTAPGKCYKLFTKAREHTFEQYPLPEIQRIPLSEVILNAKILRLGKVKPFFEKLMDPPNTKGLDLALKLLENQNLLDQKEQLTPLGYHVAKISLDPQIGKMILMGALFSCLDPILSVAACLSFKDPFEFLIDKEHLIRQKRKLFAEDSSSDHYCLSNAVIYWEEAEAEGRGKNFAYNNFLSHHNLELISNMKKQFAEYLRQMNFALSGNPKDPRSNVNSQNPSLIKAIVCSGLYPNVAMMKKVIKTKKDHRTMKLLCKTIDHPRVTIHTKSTLYDTKRFESPFIVFFEKMKTTAINIHDATIVYPMALVFFGERCDIIQDKTYSIRVDNMIKFSSKRRTAELVKRLRNELVWILEEAVLFPSVIDWRDENGKTLILKAISRLITSEDKSHSLEDFDVEFGEE